MPPRRPALASTAKACRKRLRRKASGGARLAGLGGDRRLRGAGGAARGAGGTDLEGGKKIIMDVDRGIPLAGPTKAQGSGDLIAFSSPPVPRHHRNRVVIDGGTVPNRLKKSPAAQTGSDLQERCRNVFSHATHGNVTIRASALCLGEQHEPRREGWVWGKIPRQPNRHDCSRCAGSHRTRGDFVPEILGNDGSGTPMMETRVIYGDGSKIGAMTNARPTLAILSEFVPGTFADFHRGCRSAMRSSCRKGCRR